MKILLALMLSGLFLGSILLYQVSRTLPLKELRRRARSGKDKEAAAVYKLAAHGDSLAIFLWFIGTLSVAGLILMTATSTWLALALVVVASWLVATSRPLYTTTGILWKTAAFTAPVVTYILLQLQPVLGRLAQIKPGSSYRHSGIYEKEDLLEFLGGSHANSRISETEINLALGALTFADKQVGTAMTPVSEIKFVAQSEVIGPHLMDELHASGLKYFPVVKDLKKTAKPEIVGTLYLKDVINHSGEGRVAQVMKPEVNYIHESQSLHDALVAFTRTQNHVFVVTNEFEEITGLISLEDLTTQILGQKPDADIDRRRDPIAVADLEPVAAEVEQPTVPESADQDPDSQT